MTPQICLVPKLDGLGGMVSFQAKFIKGLKERSLPYTFDIDHPENTVILVRRGIRIVQRLNGMNWLHKVKKLPLAAAMKAELNNQTLAFIRRFLASDIIYQSEFSRVWWEREFGNPSKSVSIIYNGVDLSQYTPQGPENPPEDHFRLLLVEGHLTLASSQGLETVVRLTRALKVDHGLTVELMVVGDVDDAFIFLFHAMNVIIRFQKYEISTNLYVLASKMMNK